MWGWLRRLFRPVEVEQSEPVEDPYSRLIVVCGMARTGSTALTAYIGTHPDVVLVVDGAQWYRAETDLVQDDIQWDVIDRLLEASKPKYVLIKRPWLERRLEFFERARMAKVIVCFRGKEALFRSWNTSLMAGEEGRHNPDKVYDGQIAYCESLLDCGALRMDHEDLGPHQAKRLGEFLGIDPNGFDASRIEQYWRSLNERQWIRENAMWLDDDGRDR
jgi:hypothetical protein